MLSSSFVIFVVAAAAYASPAPQIVATPAGDANASAFVSPSIITSTFTANISTIAPTSTTVGCPVNTMISAVPFSSASTPGTVSTITFDSPSVASSCAQTSWALHDGGHSSITITETVTIISEHICPDGPITTTVIESSSPSGLTTTSTVSGTGSEVTTTVDIVPDPTIITSVVGGTSSAVIITTVIVPDPTVTTTDDAPTSTVVVSNDVEPTASSGVPTTTAIIITSSAVTSTISI